MVMSLSQVLLRMGREVSARNFIIACLFLVVLPGMVGPAGEWKAPETDWIKILVSTADLYT